MTTYREHLAWATQRLLAADVPDAAVDAWYLLEHITGMSRAVFFLKENEVMSESEQKLYKEVLEKRIKRIPLQYITGSQEFMGYPFYVDSSTLIPRQDTEILVEKVSHEATGKKVLDLCTGTGCIIISLAKLCQLSRAVGTDISEKAIETAKKNADALNADVRFFCGDLFDAVPKESKFDIIVSNPPYIPSAVIETLLPEVKEFEPLSALDGDVDGLRFYQKIAEQAGKYLVFGGKLFLEIGCEQAMDVSKLLQENGFYNIQVEKDLAGLNRVVIATFGNVK